MSETVFAADPTRLLIAALVRASVGAAVVAMTMAAGIMASMPAVAGLSPLYLAAMVCAITGGATAFSHVNDSGFWLVNRKSATDMIKQLMYLDRIDTGKPVTVYINSPGGEVVSGLAVYDYIKVMKSPVNTVCMGSAASMGAILFLAGKERSMLKNSEIMIHDPSFSAGNISGKKPLEIQERLDQLMDTREKLAGIIAERTGMTKKQVYQKTEKDSYLNAEESLKCGIATKIIE